MCCPFIQMPVQQVCSHRHHHKHISNAMRYHIRVAPASLGNRHFAASLWSHRTTAAYVVCPWLRCCYVVHGCIVLYILNAPMLSVIKVMYIYLIFHNHCTCYKAKYICPLKHLFSKCRMLLICGRYLLRCWWEISE